MPRRLTQILGFARVVGVVTCVAALGCDSSFSAPHSEKAIEISSATPGPSTQDSRVEPSSLEPANEVSIDRPPRIRVEDFQPVDAAGLEHKVGEYANKIVLVDCWALWCTNCLEQMPHTIERSQTLRSRGLVVLGLNFDPPDDSAKLALAVEVLNEMGADFPQLQSSVTPSVKAMDEFDINEGLPHYRLYSQGKLIGTFSESDEELDAAIDAALSDLQ